jgi:hypothetical protein
MIIEPRRHGEHGGSVGDGVKLENGIVEKENKKGTDGLSVPVIGRAKVAVAP